MNERRKRLAGQARHELRARRRRRVEGGATDVADVHAAVVRVECRVRRLRHHAATLPPAEATQVHVLLVAAARARRDEVSAALVVNVAKAEAADALVIHRAITRRGRGRRALRTHPSWVFCTTRVCNLRYPQF